MTERPIARLVSTVLACGLLWASTEPADAQVLSLAEDSSSDHVMTASVGVEHAVVTSLGYGRRVGVVADRPVTAVVVVTLPWAALDAGDWALEAGAFTRVLGSSSWLLGNDVRLRARRSAGAIADIVQFAVRAKLCGGYFTPKGWLSLAVTYDKSLLTHLAHSDRYRDVHYPGARNGWTGSAGGSLEGAVEGGLNVTPRAALTARVGMHTTEDATSVMLPYLASIGANVRF